ncbi:MAG: hypothetical protein Q9195_006342 [Heterodermia aff. obscurata]
MATAQLREAQALGTLKTIVQMNRLDIVRFGENQKLCIATTGLGSCHAVAIVSRKATILAHISPRDPEDKSNNTSERWIESKIEEVIACFTANQSYFENQGSSGIVIYAICKYTREVLLKDQVILLAANIEAKIRVKAKSSTYKVPIERQDPDQGTVLIRGSTAGQLPVVWVEHKTVQLSGVQAPMKDIILRCYSRQDSVTISVQAGRFEHSRKFAKSLEGIKKTIT